MKNVEDRVDGDQRMEKEFKARLDEFTKAATQQ
jgi:hypothetical protein